MGGLDMTKLGMYDEELPESAVTLHNLTPTPKQVVVDMEDDEVPPEECISLEVPVTYAIKIQYPNFTLGLYKMFIYSSGINNARHVYTLKYKHEGKWYQVKAESLIPIPITEGMKINATVEDTKSNMSSPWKTAVFSL